VVLSVFLIEKLIEAPAFLNKERYILSGMIGTEVDTIKAKLNNTPLFIHTTEPRNFWFNLIEKNFQPSDFPS